MSLLGRCLSDMAFSALLLVSLLASSAAYAKPLTDEQQLMFYRKCRSDHADKDVYFAKKFCGCSDQAFLNDIPVEKAAKVCVDYARTNG